MKENIYKEIVLENGQKLMICDLSRKIGQDAYVVLMKAVIEVDIQKELFSGDDAADIEYQDVKAVLGGPVTYEYAVERNFIMAPDKEKVFESLVNTFMENLGPYVSKPNFPIKLILKQYRDTMDK